MRLCAVIPMKDPSDAKTRLGSALSERGRAGLARTLFRNTLRTVAAVPAFERVLVVTGSDDIVALAQKQGAHVLPQRPAGLNAAAAHAAAEVSAEGFDGLMLVPGDLADPDPADLAALCDLARPHSAVIAPAHDGGTNALLVCPPNGIEFAYGARSSVAHQRAALAAGLSCTLAVKPSLLHDIDTSDDLERLLGHSPGRVFEGFAS